MYWLSYDDYGRGVLAHDLDNFGIAIRMSSASELLVVGYHELGGTG